MGKFQNWLYGIVAAVLIGSGGWAWGYAFSTESRVSKLEAHYEDLAHGQDRIENAVIRIEDWIKGHPKGQ